MLSWVQGMLSNTECCAMRGSPEGFSRRANLVETGFPGPAPASPRRCYESGPLPGDFFERLADLCVNDHRIGRLIDDDRTSSIIWGQTKSARVGFLQMCIRDNFSQCRNLWENLSEFQRKEFISCYNNGPSSRDYFTDIMVSEQHMFGELASESGSGVSQRSDSTYRSIAEMLEM